MYDLSALNPLASMGPVLAREALKESNYSQDADRQFVKLFVTEVLKQSLANVASIGDVDNKKSLFPSYNSTVYNDLMIEKVGEELIDSGAFEIDQFMPNTNSANWKNIVNQARQEWLR